MNQPETMPKIEAPNLPANVLVLYPGSKDVQYFSCPSKKQLLAQVNSLCPPQLCPDNDMVVMRMLQRMNEALTARKNSPIPNEGPKFEAPGGIASKAASYVKAKIGGPARPEVADRRLFLCRHGGVGCEKCSVWLVYDKATHKWACPNCDKVVDASDSHPQCPYLKLVDDGKEFCTQCGCGQSKDAELQNKTKMAKASCPRGMWPTDQELSDGTD